MRMPAPWHALAVAGLLAAHYALAYTATLGSGTTFDEVLHTTAGVAYWTLDDYRLQPENGNLPQRWCAIPLVFMDLEFPTLDQKLWRESNAILLGRQYLYWLGNDADRILAAARAMATVWSTALCLVVYAWSRSLYGPNGGLVSLVLAAFWPAVVAHGPLATSDACGALFFTLGAWSLWELLGRVTPVTLAAAFLAVGLAAIAKHSSVLLAPVALAFAAATTLLDRPLTIRLPGLAGTAARRTTQALTRAAILIVPLAGAVFFIWASCGFRYAAGSAAGGPYEFYRYETLANCAARAGSVGRLCLALGEWRLLPEAWLYGMSYVATTALERNAFAVGNYSLRGWWWFFPLCLTIKNTLPSLSLALGGIGLWGRSAWQAIAGRSLAEPRFLGPLPLVIMLVVLWPTLITTQLNIGERHLLPSYPPLMILAGATWAWSQSRLAHGLVLAALCLHAADVAARWPWSLAYFNQIVPRGQEYRWLVDSSLDWGQDLPRLARWVDRHARPGEPVSLCYFGSCLTDVVMPQAEIIGLAPSPGRPQRLRPGLYCISATALQAVYHPPSGRWCRRFEEVYQRSRAYVTTLQDSSAAVDDERAAAAIVNETYEDGLDVADDDGSVRDAAIYAFNMLQSGRLRAYLRHRPPDGSIGGSILIFRLSAADLAAALTGPPVELDDVSWMQRDIGGDATELWRRGNRLAREGNSLEAERALERAAGLDANNGGIWTDLGLVYQARGRTKLAEDSFTKAVDLLGDSPAPFYNRGNLRAAHGRLDEAVADYGRAIAIDPGYRAAYFNRGAIRLRQGLSAEAVADFTAFRRLGGTLPEEAQKLLDAAPPAAAGPTHER